MPHGISRTHSVGWVTGWADTAVWATAAFPGAAHPAVSSVIHCRVTVPVFRTVNLAR